MRIIQAIVECLLRYIEYIDLLKMCCLTVISGDRSCTVSVSSSLMHILGSSVSPMNCGSRTQPWKLESAPGQRINISLIDFMKTDGKVETGNSKGRQYGYILDKAERRNVSLCATDTRETNVYLSVKNVLEIVVIQDRTSRGETRNVGKFLVSFQGC